MKILFMGTPEFAVPSLNALLGAGHTVCGVFTQPDKPKNRGMKLLPSPVKVCALSHEIPVFQPAKMRDGEALGYLRELDPELIVVAAYGKILPSEILDYPVKGCINVHSSLLPKYRGAAPINWAILNGEAVTGVTIMHMAPALDAGDIIAQASTPIGADETAPMLTARLAELGAELLVSAVEAIGAGTAVRTPQDEAGSTYAPMLSRELSPMDWNKPARTLHDQVRGLLPWPAAVAEFGGIRCKVFSTDIPLQTTDAAPGTILEAGKRGIDIACGGGTVLHIDELQADGGKRMKAADYLRGHPLN
ncbi:methionyl-tRNA formyltransferase [Intestinimonas massiliensis]|uniref:Methionyl-tRNA formyltransferase n=1 Tax=Intestinimonas massiliensis (ex Afouda et al. 2020) TaxID=1673721 RepID=A0ABS9M691_9FIRM|nr:methionyl-tRNA formyltransferase [Intestinimonas massiliensis (ex Afouda et al. 2020)]MCQ4806003.1 methionyl-tRNA formyltransferase [Intestinimonas massiliensis (ex Afouda et al. 2020)]